MTYTKNHDPWTVASPLTGAAFAHLDSVQWLAIKYDADNHNHDTRYYTKTLADDTFFSTSYYSDFDADKLDGSDVDAFIGSAIPIGGIVIWKEGSGTIPANYGVCDGTAYGGKTSPDLRDRFVICAGSAYSVSQTGGAATFTPTGSVAVGSHYLTTAEIPSHHHSYIDYYNPYGNGPDHTAAGMGNGYTGGTYTARNAEYQNEGGGGSHNHTSGSSITFSAASTLPVYYSMIYIMKYT
ncbi:MAG: hypothetical protein WC455_24415 [Dehalococcoidia bacterium]|jgi:hypothetical protein